MSLAFPNTSVAAAAPADEQSEAIAASAMAKPLSSPHKQARFKSKYVSEIQLIMYTCGDIKQPLYETAMAIEELCHETLVRVLRGLAMSCIRRGLRVVSPEDLMFVVRRDDRTLGRLREYLGWREVRKMSNNNSSSGNTEQSIGPEVDSLPLRKKLAATPRLSWSLSGYLEDLEYYSGDSLTDEKVLDKVDGFGLTTDIRLKHADALTRAMSAQEYLEYADCRQSSSFTYKKGKKFREWLSPAASTDYRINDEVLEMFGLLACIVVEEITLTALLFKDREEKEAGENIIGNNTDLGDSVFSISMFQKPSAKKALQTQHVRAAYWKLLRSHQLFAFS